MVIIVIVLMCILVIVYCLYGIFMMVKVFKVNDDKLMFVYMFEDGKDYVFINKWVLFGYYFVVIVVVGLLVGLILVV